jgi:carbon-monoxide dehydrogenase large subunit
MPRHTAPKPFAGRREDERLVTGRGRYTGDFSLPGQLYGAFLRADRAHAAIGSIDAAAAAAAPGVRLVLTGEDFAGREFQALPPLAQFPGRGGMTIRAPERPPLAHRKVCFGGEPVALVVATSANAARDAVELIAVEYSDLPAAIGVEEALAAGAPLVHDSAPRNVCFDFDYGDEPAACAAIARATHVARVTMDSPRVAPSPLEPRAVLASYDAAAGRYVVRCGHQGALLMRDSIAVMLGVDPARVRVELVDVGGAFGARAAPYGEYIALLHAAKVAGMPVKWVSTRSEDLLSDAHGRAVRLRGELALDSSGRFLALRTDWLADTGAYPSLAGAFANCVNGRTMGAGPYRVEALYGRHRQIFTNTAPTDVYRGAGRPEAAFVVERLIDEAAAALRVDPLDLRRRNAIPRGAMPYTTLTGTALEATDFEAMLGAAAAEADWNGFAVRREAAEGRGRLRGIGCAAFIEPAGGGVPKDQVAVRFAPDGEVQLFMAAGASGQGHETVFTELVAEWLGIAPETIALRAGDPDGPALVGGAAIGSRTALSQGSALKAAADEIVRKATALAAQSLEVAESDIAFRGGRYLVAGTDRSIALVDLVERHRTAGAHPLDTIGEAPAPRAFPSGVHVCEVEIDPETGTSEIVHYIAVDDVGCALNPVVVAGQLHGGIAQGLGQVFGEQVSYHADTGQLLTGTFQDYTMPRADALPSFRLIDHHVPSVGNALGAKGAGEAGATGGLPAGMNAVMDALRSAGVAHFDMPASPHRVWCALQRAGR